MFMEISRIIPFHAVKLYINEFWNFMLSIVKRWTQNVNSDMFSWCKFEHDKKNIKPNFQIEAIFFQIY